MMVEEKKTTKAVALFSGGLDSAIAIRLMRDQGIEVHGLYCAMPWGDGNLKRCERLAKTIGIPMVVERLGDDYLEVVRHPQYGYGRAINPCMDCHRFMLMTAEARRQRIGADFIVTGDVLGQRPFSQRKESFRLMEEGMAFEGRVVRPLSALFLPVTIPEKEGLVDRTRLLRVAGRSRKIQMALAEEWGIEGYEAPAGGCVLTQVNFAPRVRDFLAFPYREARDMDILNCGRYFRVSEGCIAVAGRDQMDNKALVAHAREGDYLVELVGVNGPMVLARGPSVGADEIATAGGLAQYFSKARALVAQEIVVRRWPFKEAEASAARTLTEREVMTLSR